MSFDIIEYLSGLTGFVFDKSVLQNVALERGADKVIEFSELTKEQKDLMLADLLSVAYMSPNVMASYSKQHGAFTQSIGSQTVYDMDRILGIITQIYKRYNEDEKLDLILGASSNLQWLE